MTQTVTPRQIGDSRPQTRRRKRTAPRSNRPAHEREQGLLGRYTNPSGLAREIVARPAAGGSVLVIDRDASSLGDRRLVAHLDADEPAGNAAVVCREYLNDRNGRWCRRVTDTDLRQAPFTAGPAYDSGVGVELRDRLGRSYRLQTRPARTGIPELRWCRRSDGERPAVPTAVSLREIVGALESYEPARAFTEAAIAGYAREERISVTTLRAELQRLDASRIVLNRGLREAVLAASRTEGVSLSQIALRCGRRKRDGRGRHSGETSWLARRVGLLPESSGETPTPWIHSEVLALIARRGLGRSPREVELG